MGPLFLNLQSDVYFLDQKLRILNKIDKRMRSIRCRKMRVKVESGNATIYIMSKF